MKLYPRHTMFLAALLPTLLATGCHAQEASSTTAQAATPSVTQVTESNDLFVTNDSLKVVYFDSGKSQLDPKSMEGLKNNVAWLRMNLPLQIQVAGYSDGHGTAEQNLAMGQRRAAALREFYVTMGIPRSRISTVTHGQEEPACFDDTPECDAKNRRVETLILNKSLAAR